MSTGERRLALYARVSRDKGESRSITEQLDELRGWARREGWSVVAEFSDSISASRYTKRERPGWQGVMELINAGRVDALAVWEISRTARDRPVFAALLAACVENEVAVAAGGRLHDPNDPDDGFMLDLGGALAVRESTITSKRTRRDVEARALLGKPHGSMPFGYRKVVDPDTGKTVGRVIHPEQGPVVQEIVRRLLDREPADKVARDLNERGIPTATGKAWRGGNLRILAVRPTYAGLRVHRGRVLDDVEATWKPIITAEEHHRIVAMFADPGRDKFRNSTHVKHLGAGLFRCGREGCDGVMRVAVQVDRPNRYDCRICHKVSRHQAPVDEAVERLVVARLSMPDALAAFTPDDGDARAAGVEVVRLENKLAEARAMWESDDLSLTSYRDMEVRLAPRISAARERARRVGAPAVLSEFAGADAARRWSKASVVRRRSVLAALVTVTILPVGRGGQPFDPAGLGVEWKSAVI